MTTDLETRTFATVIAGAQEPRLRCFYFHCFICWWCSRWTLVTRRDVTIPVARPAADLLSADGKVTCR